MEDFINEVSDNAMNEFDKDLFDHQARNNELFRYTFPELGNTLKMLCCNTKALMNGFEVLRLLIRVHDPIKGNKAARDSSRGSRTSSNTSAIH